MRLPDFDVSRRVSVHLGHALERPRIHAIEDAAAVRALGENSRTRLLHEPWEFAFGLEAAPGTSGTRERVFGETILVDVNPVEAKRRDGGVVLLQDPLTPARARGEVLQKVEADQVQRAVLLVVEEPLTVRLGEGLLSAIESAVRERRHPALAA